MKRLYEKENKSEFAVDYPDRYTPDQGWREQRPKCCDSKNKDEDNSPNINSFNESCRVE